MALFYVLLCCAYCALLLPQGSAEDILISTSDGFDQLLTQSRDTLSFHGDVNDVADSHRRFTTKDLSDEDGVSADSLKRRRRSIIIQNGPGGDVSVEGLSAMQTCYGITLSWTPPKLPYSSKYDYTNSEFKYYNVYRSRNFFSDVTSMQPYASGLHERALRKVEAQEWTDRYPTPMVDWFYAVTVVDGRENENKRVTAQKVQFIAAIQKEGVPIPLMPGSLRGRALRHSAAYNPNRDEYFIAFDLDINGDGLADHLYGLRLSSAGLIVDKTILNFTVNLPNWAGGEQGWPSAVFNPKANEYLVLFHYRSMRHFHNKLIILAQRVLSAKTARAASPSLTAQDRSGRSHAMQPRLLYNPATGGYVSTFIVKKPKKDVFHMYLDQRGRSVSPPKDVCSFKSHAFEHNLFLDTKRNEIYFACVVEKRGAPMQGVRLQNQPYVIVVTKKNATGGHAANTASQNTKNFVSFTSKRDANLEGYYNDKADRLFIFWEDTVNGRQVIQKASVFLNRQGFIRKKSIDKCGVKREVRTPVPMSEPLSGSHYLLWQERDARSWSIGGRFMKGSFNLANREQRRPVVVYNMRSDMGLVVWQEVVGNQVKLIARHFRYSFSHSCAPACTGGQRCVQQDTCAVTGPNMCSTRPCSHTCHSLPNQRFECSCPRSMQLADDKKTCKGSVVPCHGMTPLKNPSTGRNYVCGRGPNSINCPSGSYCHVHPADAFAVCCKNQMPSHTVLVTSLGTIWQATVNPGQRHTAIKRLPVTQGIIVVAMAYDPIDKRVYWSDVAVQKISRAHLDGKGEESIINSNILVPDGMCLDTVERKIYWTDIGLKRIERAELDGSNRQVLETVGVDKPRGIVLFRKRRQMYWTDWGASAKIERGSMDGGRRKTIVSGGLFWPNGIVIDEMTSQLYWADARLDKIETSDLEGRNRRLLIGGDIAKHPYSLTIFGNRLFWSDWDIRGVQSVDKTTGKDEVIAIEGLQQPKGLVVIPSKARPGIRKSSQILEDLRPSKAHERCFTTLDNSFEMMLAKLSTEEERFNIAETPCPDPGPPANGNRHPMPRPSGDYAKGTKVLFTCNPDFVHSGDSTRVCQKNGRWSGKATTCSARPVFTSTPQNVTIKEGGSPLLKCSASLRGRPMTGHNRVKWFKDGIAMPMSSEGHYFTTYKGHLVFLVAHSSDTGLYTCKASTPGVTIEASAFMKVRGVIRMPDCGNPRFSTRARIIGGRRAGKGAHPWQVMLWNKNKNKHFCGGTLITDRWVVTAAHCLYAPGTMMPSLIQVRLGKHIRTKKEPNEQAFDTDLFKIHPHYSPSSYDSDIALIRLAKPAIFTDYVKPICLPSESSDYRLLTPNTTGTISGWGRRKAYRNKVAHRLHEATVPIRDQRSCVRSHPKYTVTANMFCAGFNDSSKGDACQGDSGGPFAVDNPLPTTPSGHHRHVLVGVISWGDGCGKIGKYGVYTRMYNFVDWILKEIFV